MQPTTRAGAERAYMVQGALAHRDRAGGDSADSANRRRAGSAQVHAYRSQPAEAMPLTLQ